jgi:hypothetical protein
MRGFYWRVLSVFLTSHSFSVTFLTLGLHPFLFSSKETHDTLAFWFSCNEFGWGTYYVLLMSIFFFGRKTPPYNREHKCHNGNPQTTLISPWPRTYLEKSVVCPTWIIPGYDSYEGGQTRNPSVIEIKWELNRRLIYECLCDERLKDKTEGSTRRVTTHIHRVVRGTGTPKGRDDDNRREVWECDWWVCDLEAIGVSSIFIVMCSWWGCGQLSIWVFTSSLHLLWQLIQFWYRTCRPGTVLLATWKNSVWSTLKGWKRTKVYVVLTCLVNISLI